MTILRQATQKSEGVSIEELMHALQVSKRTVYREISKLENTLHLVNLELEKNGKLYQLKGSDEDINQLLQQIKMPQPIEWFNVEKRQFAALATIALQNDEKYTTSDLANHFDVSLTTIQQDISNLNEILSKYHMTVKSGSDNYLFLSGNEVYIRLYLSQVLSKEINEFDFIQVVKNEANGEVETESKYMLTLVDNQILRMVYESFEKEQPEILNKLTDDYLMRFVFILTITLMRLSNNKQLETNLKIDRNQLLPYMNQVLSIVRVFKPEYKSLLVTNEISFFAMQLRGLNLSKEHSIFQDTYDIELGYEVKYLIKLVSEDIQFDFNADNVLYHDLVNHIGAALKRLDLKLPEMENSVITKLKKEYSHLYSIIEEKLIEVFSPAIFSEQEIGYVVTHFASSFEKHGYRSEVEVLVVCTSGIGTSKILKARLERSISNIKKIDVVRTVDLENIDIKNYEIIFSTIVLPGFDYDYHLINPILDDSDIESIKARINRYRLKSNAVPVVTTPIINKNISFKKIKRMVEIIELVLNKFKVIDLTDDFMTINQFLEFLFYDNQPLKKKLERRLNESPLAIPNTGIILLHTTDSSIKTPSVELYNLEKKIPAIGMDRQPTEVNRMILMLAPEEMDELTADFLGAISSSIIEREDYTKLYQKGSYFDLKELLEYISVDVLKNLMK